MKKHRHTTYALPTRHVTVTNVDEVCRLAEKRGYTFKAAIPSAAWTVLVFVRDET